MPGAVTKLLADHWNLIKTRIHKARGVTKRALKPQLKPPIARNLKAVYMRLNQPHTRYIDTLRNTCCCSITLLYFLELPCTDFGIEDIVAGTTPVTILRELFYHFYYYRDEGLAPSGCIHSNWWICTSSISINKFKDES